MNSKTLVIDDEEISLMLTEFLLKDSPLASEIITFSDGVHAIEYLKSKYREDTQYVIILDINMPLMNGWEFLDELNSCMPVKNFKIFMLSSSTDQADINASKRISYVEGYFCKPLKKEDVDKIYKSEQK